MSLRNKTLSSLFWSFLEKLGSRGIGVLVTIVLARLLTPQDFGLVAMLAIFIEISQTLTDAGFNQALIQKKGTDEEDFSTVFYINLTTSVFLYILLFTGAPWIAGFYDQPLLTPMARVLGLVFVINSFSYVQTARLRKQLRFKTLMSVHIPSTVISGIVAMIMAWKGFGVWSLVAQSLVARLAFAIQIWVYAKWKPLWVFNRAKAKGLFSYGSKLMLGGILNRIFGNLYIIVIGKYFSIEILGYYKNARNLESMPTKTLSNAIKSVTFPIFSEIQNDDKRLKNGYKKAIQQILFWISPLMILAGVMAEPLFRFVLTEKWMPAVPYFQILCIYSILRPLADFNLDVVKVKGMSGLYLKLNITKKTIMAILLAITLPFGIFAILWGSNLYLFLCFLINGYFSGKYIGYSISEQLKDIGPIFGAAFFSGFMIWIGMLYTSQWHDLIILATGTLMGFGIYGIIVHWFKLDAYIDFMEIAGSGKRKMLKR